MHCAQDLCTTKDLRICGANPTVGSRITPANDNRNKWTNLLDLIRQILKETPKLVLSSALQR